MLKTGYMTAPVALFFCSTLVAFGGAPAAKAAEVAGDEEKPTLYAQNTDDAAPSSDAPAKGKRKKKPNKRVAPLHAAQEGKEEPYKWEADLLSDFSRTTTQTGDVKGGSGNYSLGVRALYILGASFEVGAELTYNETSTKSGSTTATDKSDIIDLIVAYNFGNLDKDTHVFFVDANFGIGSGTNSQPDLVNGGTKSTTTSLSDYGLGLGVHYFVDSNVALTAEFRYEGDTSKSSEDGAPTTTGNTIHFLKLGFTLFIE